MTEEEHDMIKDIQSRLRAMESRLIIVESHAGKTHDWLFGPGPSGKLRYETIDQGLRLSFTARIGATFLVGVIGVLSTIGGLYLMAKGIWGADR